ncbi:DUF1707 domain-containing protein [Salinadaptatus halalkaliphilus]|uniref:DUF1707 domain-containing protein n=1 Tax=Salinadaptatus halalkaliphilus TaxID=2419781 RepID=A0A4S3TQP8_9EURY|nr:DUF1707 domain-containing protein [Salinadaptatus halalkaliphilus]THE65643.1 DUF1707 domain-containing protein [Salinadaptatus halalkaliphilus]
MGSESGSRDYSLTEIFAIKFVLADVVIIVALLLAGPWVAVAITALFVLSFVFLWYVMEGSSDDEATTQRATESTAERPDPVTRLQQRYADGDLSESEFERRLERLIDANERADAAGLETDDLELERSG